ncbi:hypothetical protein ACU686_22900 [Yinghuangia aomiensis]
MARRHLPADLPARRPGGTEVRCDVPSLDGVPSLGEPIGIALPDAPCVPRPRGGGHVTRDPRRGPDGSGRRSTARGGRTAAPHGRPVAAPAAPARRRVLPLSARAHRQAVVRRQGRRRRPPGLARHPRLAGIHRRALAHRENRWCCRRSAAAWSSASSSPWC